VAIAVLLAAAFVIGWATGTTTKSTNIVPAAHVQSDPYSCPRRGPC